MTPSDTPTPEQAAPEMLPCPFCGASIQYHSGYACAVHQDDDCFLSGVVIWHGDGVAAWNRRAAPSAPAEVEAAGWQPIETAPETDDYAPLFWLWEPHDMGGFMFAGTRNIAGEWINNIDMMPQSPTHWMPLPEPPALAGGRCAPEAPDHIAAAGKMAPSAPAEVEGLVLPEMFGVCQHCIDYGNDEEAGHHLEDLRWDGEVWSCEYCWNPDESESWADAPQADTALTARQDRAEAALMAGLAACDQFDSPVSSSAFVNGQATCAQQIRAKLKGDV